MTCIDIIAAVRNEEKGIPLFLIAVRGLPLAEDLSLRMICVEDSSTDNTVSVLRELSENGQDVSYYSLKQGFGQGPAIVYGLMKSTGDAAIMMDSDDGHPVDLIPDLINEYRKGRHGSGSALLYRRAEAV